MPSFMSLGRELCVPKDPVPMSLWTKVSVCPWVSGSRSLEKAGQGFPEGSCLGKCGFSQYIPIFHVMPHLSETAVSLGT